MNQECILTSINAARDTYYVIIRHLKLPHGICKLIWHMHMHSNVYPIIH